MNSFLLYLLKVSIGLAIISLPYYLLLRKDTNLNLKRFFLIGRLILSFILPLLNISISSRIISDIPVVFMDIPSPSFEGFADNETIPKVSKSISIDFFVLTFYLLGIIVLFSRNIFSILSWIKLKKDSISRNDGVLYSEKNVVFPLFRAIHLPKSILNSDAHSSILTHEQAHIRQFHFVDLLISEIAILLTWFNPFSWLITRMIKENHEHLADREVLSKGVNPARYRAFLLNQTLGVPVIRLGHSINHSLTKNRFVMIKKFNSKNSALVKTMLLMPAILLTLGFVNISKAQEGNFQGNIKFSDTGKPATGASILIEGTTFGTVVDENGNFDIMLNSKSRIVISYIGYNTLVIDCEPGQTKKLSLDPSVINLNIDQKAVNEKALTEDSVSGDIQPIYSFDGVRVDDIVAAMKDYLENVEDRSKTAFNLKMSKIESSRGVIEVTSIKREEIDSSKGVVEVTTKKQEEPDLEDKEVFYIVEEMPEYPGGKEAMSEYIYSNLDYPAYAVENKIEGRVMVQFFVNSKGKVVSPKVVGPTDNIFSVSALKVFQEMPDWSPGKQRGKAVSVKFTVPVDFKLQEEDKETFYIVEDMPKFPGGKEGMTEYIYSNLEYPPYAEKNNIEGDVVVQFIVNSKGKVVSPKVVNASDNIFSVPALKVFQKMPDWSPGKQRGKAVSVKFTVPVDFKLQEPES